LKVGEVGIFKIGMYIHWRPAVSLQNYWTVAEVAQYLRLSTSHLNKLRIYRPELSPPFVRFGKSVRYPVDGPKGLTAWAAAKAGDA